MNQREAAEHRDILEQAEADIGETAPAKRWRPGAWKLSPNA